MRILQILTATLLLLFTAAGCATTPPARIEKNRPAFDSYSAEVQEKIRAGNVDLGFTPPMVRFALGEPERELRRASAAGEEDVWVYRRPAAGFGFGLGIGGGGGRTGYGAGVSLSTATNSDEDAMRIIFREGKVTAIEKRIK